MRNREEQLRKQEHGSWLWVPLAPLLLLPVLLVALLKDVNDGYTSRLWVYSGLVWIPLYVAVALGLVPFLALFALVCWVNEPKGNPVEEPTSD